MANFLKQIITAAEETELNSLRSSFKEIENLTATFENELLSYIDRAYITFNECPSDLKYGDQTEKLISQLNELKSKVDTMVKKEHVKQEANFVQYENKLIVMDKKLAYCAYISKVHDSYLRIYDLKREKEYLKTMFEIVEISEYIQSKSLIRDKYIRPLYNFIDIERDMLAKKFKAMLNSEFKYNSTNDKVVTISISNSEIIEQVLQVLYIKGDFGELDVFIHFLQNIVFKQLINTTADILIKRKDNVNELTIKFHDKKSDYNLVFNNFIVVLDYLHDNFNYKLSTDSETTTLNYIGNKIRDTLVKLIIDSCLGPTIPKTEQEFKIYNTVIEHTELLQKYLVNAKIFPADFTTMVDYAKNVDVHFINKKCGAYLSSALDLMRKDLNNTTVVGRVEMDSNDPTEDQILRGEDDVSQCAISASVNEIIRNLELIFTEARDFQNTNPKCSNRLCATANDILQQYGPVVMDYHGKLRQATPQQIAIFFNNCAYLTHILNAPMWRQYTTPMENTLFEYIELEQFGNKMLQHFIDDQIKQVRDTIGQCGLDNIVACISFEGIEKSVRQCLQQQELLKIDWQNILNYHIYNSTMGLILNALCASIIEAILKNQHIHEKAARHCGDIIKLILSHGPELFTDRQEINSYVKNWYKFVELDFVINANLIHIADRWTDGKKLLAKQFKPDEIKDLMRSLFKDTDGLATVLDQINI